MNQSKLIEISSKLGGLLITKGLSFTSAESCTGGWVSQSLTSVPGSSGWFGYGFVVYSNAAKSKILGVLGMVWSVLTYINNKIDLLNLAFY